jgi:hypothetical protein
MVIASPDHTGGADVSLSDYPFHSVLRFSSFFPFLHSAGNDQTGVRMHEIDSLAV